MTAQLHHLGEASQAPIAATISKGHSHANPVSPTALSRKYMATGNSFQACCMGKGPTAMPHCTLKPVTKGASCAAGSLTVEHLSLDPKANPAATEILKQPVQDTEKSLLGSINMTLLLRSRSHLAQTIFSKWEVLQKADKIVQGSSLPFETCETAGVCTPSTATFPAWDSGSFTGL